jgi:hypothetical protein
MEAISPAVLAGIKASHVAYCNWGAYTVFEPSRQIA